ncbi:aspartate/glutamate racemase family protein [Bradyrhizobium sp. 180]|uniref:aspartate/glutamate racemase family protein n=1 Tax=unclassified Bradyrhizobium TaxID=2631580 RepID=UPI001FFAC577|nr:MULTISPECIES: aspartate/glutamate racemase family protein [unclassified Bradyrhizobium]MCK1421888.1 aspartate/glutamate racemase family protein [Bradyrhizobium sp. CW12]MCK1492508.1 aspartate/glutamate racemase family protein [Bradyrhizobium sp. 180]MCK1528637.1 aspartate/glutamate racemase family protein [Bradyrhizobium sp. 182]MCK1598283.1 aspartate/glutamate racemase family protein [Bradyrhizobium sp. 164]MCK1648480.1 aspartate/glutamate racemase family protein [Bradyrhizobium sp. 154]
MQTIGLIGGMSWESTAFYYRLINERVRDRVGKLHSAPLLLYSYDFQEIKEMQYAGRWREAATSLSEIARRLESAGARAIVLCTNTMHKLAPEIMASVTVPFIHIGDATAERIRAKGYRRVGLLGTRFTMEEDFYIDRLRAHDLDAMIPPADERAEVNRIIYDELCLGTVAAPSRRCYQGAMAALVERGAECIILGCTEITMLVGPDDTSVETFDTTAIHAETAADFAIG